MGTLKEQLKSRSAVLERIDELDRDWDVERLLEIESSSLMIGGVILGAFVNRRWLIFAGLVAGLMLRHGLHLRHHPFGDLRRRLLTGR
jgi:hypothetical protein